MSAVGRAGSDDLSGGLGGLGGLGGGSDVVAGRYALVDPIASGGTGTVWRAYDHERDQWCAAKVMRQRHAGELLRFAREQSVRLQHPHIASPYAWAADDGTVLIASELVDGGSLHTLIGDYGPLDEPTVVVLLEQVLSALAAMHEARLVHRDVKPGNVLLRATGDGPLHCMLTDFGLTIGADDPRLTQTGMVIGTPGYLPPEVMLGTARPHPSHDVYAAGRLALTMALGLEPRTAGWPAPGHEPLGPNSQLDEERLARVVDPQLQAALRLMTEAEPARRPTDAQAAILLLAGIPRCASSRTADGDPVTVFNQLPATTTTPGLVDRSDDASGVGSDDGAVDAAAGVAVETRQETDANEEADGGTTVLRVRPTAAQREGDHDRPAPPTAPSSPPVEPLESAAAAEAPRRPARRPRRRSVGAVLAVVVAAAGTAVAAATGWGPFDDSPAPSVVPTAPIVHPAAMGEACGWQQQGDVVNAAQGPLTCRLVDGAYVWGP
ncbi:MAG: serine/threonine protein kinase [Humibacillus sp.]|nr:serine/threonine protein kinase [Humibacillus sp.]